LPPTVQPSKIVSVVGGVDVSEVRLRVVGVDDPEARGLQGRQIAEMAERYGGGGPAPLRSHEFEPPEGCFVLGTIGGTAQACGGCRHLSPGVAEIKRMYVDPDARRRGVGARLLAFLEERARAVGYRQMWLETGSEQPEAISLYVSVGYRPRAAYGEFQHDPRNRCFSRELEPESDRRLL
jgi:GNAT superfamily N-acetyltransferase